MEAKPEHVLKRTDHLIKCNSWFVDPPIRSSNFFADLGPARVGDLDLTLSRVSTDLKQIMFASFNSRPAENYTLEFDYVQGRNENRLTSDGVEYVITIAWISRLLLDSNGNDSANITKGMWHKIYSVDVCPIADRYQRAAPGSPPPPDEARKAESAKWKLPKKRRLKIVLADGSDRYQLLWLTNTGDSVMCGRYGARYKTNYHWSGQIHEKTDVGPTSGRPKGIERDTPFPKLEDVRRLHSIRFPNGKSLLQEYTFEKLTSQRVTDQLVVDLRALKPDGVYIAEVGIVGSGGASAFADYQQSRCADGKRKIVSFFLNDQVKPAMYGLLIERIDPEEGEKNAVVSNRGRLVDGGMSSIELPKSALFK